MGLRVWLPLNGDLRNNGLDDASATLTGAVAVNDSGKIGKCYQFGTGTGRITLPKTTMTNIKECSVAFWVNILGWQTNWDTFFQAGLGSTPWNNYYFGILRNQGNFLCFSICNGSTSSQGNYKSSNLTLETWYHLTFVYKEGHCLIYINGELDKDYTTTIVPNFSGINYVSIGQLGNASSYQTNCKMNDFRIYDHALSLKEIKEISKGLIVHYPLDDKYIESTTNLITGEDCLSGTCYNGAINKYGYGTNTDMYKQVTTFDGRKGTKVYNKLDGEKMYPYVYISNMYTSDGTNSPAYKTLSFDYYTTISTSICPYKLGSGNGTATYIVTNNETKTGTGTNQVVIPVKPNMWNHIEVTFHGTTEADAQWGYIQNQPSHTSDTSNFWFFANMQLEEKDHATGYAGVGKTRTPDTIYDTSGFNNNATPNNLSIDSSTSRYLYSTVFNGTNSYVKVTDFNWISQYPQELTVSIWGYADNWATQTGGRLWSCTESGGFNIEAGASGYWRFPVYCSTKSDNSSHAYVYKNDALKLSDLSSGWHMITWVYTTANQKVYVDGELYSIYTYQTYGIRFNKNARLFLGCEANSASPSSPYFNGNLSDFRIYVTALSADDVKSLYQVTASADKNNNYYSYSYDELTQGREIEHLYDAQTSSGSGTFTQDKDGLHLNQYIWVNHDYIPIDPTNKTYKWDITYSCDAGNQFYIGWERYDANKTSRSNNACVYVIATKPSSNVTKTRARGTVNLSTDGVNPCAFIRLRILNKWSGSASDTNGAATIHSLSLKEYSDTDVLTPLSHTKQGIVNTTAILENDIGVSINNTYELNSNNFYEI